MDDQRVSCEGAVTAGMTAPIEGGETESGDFLRVAHRTEAQGHPLRTKLLAVMSELIDTMADALSKDREAARECVRDVSAALLSCARDADESADTAFAESAPRPVHRGGLAPWQVRSVTTYIDANLNTSVSCEMLARLARLSVSHFARAFKCTFGDSPHVYLMRRRMERAQGLMLTSNASLAHIALECGFADQAHLSRLFLQFTGESPASWRRARASEAG
jgi:AraC-like DNA-binding protein